MKNIDFLKIYSYSKLNVFDNCPKQYYLSYLDPEVTLIKKYFRKQRDYQTKGSAVHGAITLFHHLPSEKRTFKNLKESLLKAWFSDNNPWQEPPLGVSGGFKNLEHERKIYKESLILLKNFIQMETVNPEIFYLPTKKIKDSFEDYQEMIKPLAKDIFISGKFDRIDKAENNSLKIIDYKTGGGDQDEFQLYFYKLLAELNFNKQVSIVSFFYLNKARIKNFEVPEMKTEKIKKQILKKIKKIKETKKFEIKKSGLCNYCDFKEICPGYNSLNEIKLKIKEIKDKNIKNKLF